MCSYLSKQRGRALATMTDYLNDKDYWGLSSFLRTGDLFNVQMCYHDIPEKLNLFDYMPSLRISRQALRSTSRCRKCTGISKR